MKWDIGDIQSEIKVILKDFKAYHPNGLMGHDLILYEQLETLCERLGKE